MPITDADAAANVVALSAETGGERLAANDHLRRRCSHPSGSIWSPQEVGSQTRLLGLANPSSGTPQACDLIKPLIRRPCDQETEKPGPSRTFGMPCTNRHRPTSSRNRGSHQDRLLVKDRG